MPKAKSSKDQAPSFTYLIEKKREGGEFTDEEIRSIVDAILDEEMPEFQQAAHGSWPHSSKECQLRNCLFYGRDDAFR